MTTAVQHRRGTTAEHAVFTGLEGEVTIDTTKDTAVIHDGSLAGGYPLAKESLANVNPGALSAITGSATAADDVFLMYDTSATSMKKITRAELNNAIEADALASVTITGGTINGTSVGASTASSGAFTTLSASGTSTLAAVNSGALAVTGAISATEIISANKGITFPATQVASANANTLDDYEEGTWTPTILFNGANAGMTYSSQVGLYTKVGNLVTVCCRVHLSAKGASTGPANIGGLPFTSATAVIGYGATLWMNSVSYTGYPSSYVIQNSTRAQLSELTAAGVHTDLDNTNFSDTSLLIINASYRV